MSTKKKWTGPEYLRPQEPREDTAYCRSCGLPIVWRVTPNRKKAPVDVEGGSHFATCPNADHHRKERA